MDGSFGCWAHGIEAYSWKICTWVKETKKDHFLGHHTKSPSLWDDLRIIPLPETNISQLKIGLAPKGNDPLPTIHFQV